MTGRDAIRGVAVGVLAALVAATSAEAATKVTKPTGSASVTAGDSLAVKVVVTNPSKKKAKAGQVTIKLSSVKLGALKVKALKGRQKVTVTGSLTVPAATAAGTYKLTACSGTKCTTGGTVKVTRRTTPPATPSAPAPTTPAAPAATPVPGNENLPPAPTATPGPGNPSPTPDPIPADPKDAAPPLDPGAATSVYDSTKFLFSGANPIQRDVAPGAIDAKQIAVLRGTVQTRDGAPIEGARVTVLDHDELGKTNTRADGAFDLAVNGGGVTLQFERAGYLTVQRTLAPNWQDYETLGDVVMVPLDANVKTIDPNSSEAFQVVRGSESEDKDGERQGTLLFPKGTDATMELPNGQTKPIDELKVRVTEFTYGNQGDEAMPGSLPANSGYTYAAEFSVDEALKAGATQVNFDQPLINYTENFIGAPVGSPVPTGYYDRESAEWKASKNGRVIKVLASGVDTDGDGKADTGLGMTDAERARLAQLYQPGQELWRVEITHFTPWDHNWPYGPPPGAKPPKLKEFEWGRPNDPCQQQGSQIGCETQTLGESVPVTGTNLTLNYATDRTPGWKVDETMKIPVVGQIPPRLKGIQLTIDVAGEKIEKRWCDPSFPTTGETTCKGLPPITPNIDYSFHWDGLDAYDRAIQGRVTATIKVIYVYEFNYYGASEDFGAAFSQFGSDTEVFDGRYACGNRSGTMDTHFFCGIPVGQTITRAIGSWDARPTDGLGGWTLSDHHSYDPVERALHRGDGATTRAEALPPIVKTLAGSRTRGVGSGPAPGSNFPTEGETAVGANIDYLGDYVRSPDGNLYFHNGLNRNHIFRMSRDGKLYLFAGNGSRVLSGDGGPAKDAGLGTVQALAAAPDGALLIASYDNDNATEQLRRVAPDGSKIETIAGTTNRQAPLGDGKPAKEAHIGAVADMTVAPDGTIYWTERYSQIGNWKGRLRKLAPDGLVTTVAGNGDLAAQDGNPAFDVAIGSDPKGVALGADGSIYLALQYERKVIRIDPSGRVYRFAGKGIKDERGAIVTGRPASDSYIDSPVSVAAGTDGNVYIRSLGNDVSPSASVIFRVGEDGILQQAAGRLRGTCGVGGVDGEGATSACIQNHSITIGVDGDNGVTFADGRYLIRKVAPPLPGFEADGLALPSADGLEVYEFDRLGRHLRTRDGFTGQVLQTFEYDAAKQLIGMVDAFGNRTRIERDGAGKALAIVAPGGQRTVLTVDGAGWLESVANPVGDTFRFTYDGGLLKSFKLPEGGTTRFDYDSTGRLTAHHGADGEERTLKREEIEGGSRVTIETGAGKKTTYSMEVMANGDRVRTVRQPSGATSKSVTAVDGLTTLTAADGTKTTLETQPDPRWGAAVPVLAEQVITTPAGKAVKTTETHSVTLRNAQDPFSINTLTTSFSDGGSWVYDGAAKTVTAESAEGRTTVTSLDVYGRTVKQTLGSGVAPLEYTYDAVGRPKSMKQGTQQTTYAYDARHRIISDTDAGNNVTAFAYDDADRVTEKRLPGNRVYKYSYDSNGNVATVTTPRGKVHTFTVTNDNRSKSYTPPASTGAYVRAYNTERRVQNTTLPSGAQRVMGYDDAGRLTSEDGRTFAYDGEQDRFSTITNGGQSIAYSYDGALPTSITATAGKYDYTLGDKLLPTAEKLTVGATELTRAVAFDDDRLATMSGPFTLERFGPAGSVSKITDGKLSLSYGYDANGRPATRTLSVGGTERFFQKLTFDTVGRASKREERVDGAADTLDFGYDGSGQLLTVKRGATVVEDHAYDGAGNRLDAGAAYDDQDRLTTRGGVAYTWDADGFLKTRGADTLTYSRSGELLSAMGVQYAYDALGRRVSRGNETYLYGNPANPFQVTASVVGGVVTSYYYDAEDRLFAFERGGERYYVGADAMGSPRVVVRASDGAVVRRVSYDSFGVETVTVGVVDLPIGYAGGLRDVTTGLVRFGLRDYDPASGRFVARDPSFFGGSPENLYGYVGNNPITQKDPTGLVCIGWSMYATVGGGFSFCRDNAWDWTADWSVCGEVGLGLGGGVDVDLVGTASSGRSVFAEVTGKAFWVGGTIGAELDLDCMQAKAGAKVMAGPLTIGADTTGSKSYGGGQNDLPMPGVRIEGKVGVKVCKKW